jgi:hypothetical protein
VVNLVLDGRVERRKLFSGELRFQGMGAEGPETRGQGGEQAAEDDEQGGLHGVIPVGTARP